MIETNIARKPIGTRGRPLTTLRGEVSEPVATAAGRSPVVPSASEGPAGFPTARERAARTPRSTRGDSASTIHAYRGNATSPAYNPRPATRAQRLDRPAPFLPRAQSPALALRTRRPARRRSSAGKPLLVFCALVGIVLGWRWWSAPAHAHPASGAASAAGTAGAQAANVVAAVAASVSNAASATSASALPAARADAGLQNLVQRLIDDDNGDTAVVVRNLRTGARAAVNDHDPFPSASLAKVPILFEVYRQLDAGKLRQDTMATILADDIADGAGVLQAREGDSLSVGELLDLSVSVSDNTAARILLRLIGGVDAVNRTMADLGLSQTRLYADARPNTTSASDMAALLTLLAQRGGPLATSAAAGGLPAAVPTPSAHTLAALLSLPQAQAWLTLDLPKNVVVAHKSGQLPGVRHDAAVVYAPRGPFVVVGLTANLADQDDAEAFLAHLARDVYDYFGAS